MITWRKAFPEDAALVVPMLRDADRREVLRLGEGDPCSCARRAIERSRAAGVFFDDDRPLCLFGVVDASLIDTQTGVPWLIGTVHLDCVPRAFLRETRAWVAEWRRHYSVLTNQVDAEYPQAIRWLEWLGFTIGEPKPFGTRGARFCRIELRA